MRKKITIMTIVLVHVILAFAFAFSAMLIRMASFGVGIFVSGFWWGMSVGLFFSVILVWIGFEAIREKSKMIMTCPR